MCKAVRSKISSLSATLKKPAICSNVFSPQPLTDFASIFEEYVRPRFSRSSTMFFATVLFIPGTLESNDIEAVFKSTPTDATADSTT